MFEAPERKGETVTVEAADVARAPRTPGRQHRERKSEDLRPVRGARPAACSRSSSSRPRPTPARQALERTIRELAELAPAFVSVTYGAGGSTRAKTVELVQRIQREAGLDRDGPPDLRRRQPARRSAAVLDAWSRAASRTSWPCAATRPAGQRRSSARRAASATPPSWSASSASATAPASAWAAPAYPEGARRVPRPRPGPRAPQGEGGRRRWTSWSPSCSSTTASTSTSSRARAPPASTCRSSRASCRSAPWRGIERMTGCAAPASRRALRAELERCRDDDAAVAALGSRRPPRSAVELLHGGAPGIHFYTLNSRRRRA